MAIPRTDHELASATDTSFGQMRSSSRPQQYVTLRRRFKYGRRSPKFLLRSWNHVCHITSRRLARLSDENDFVRTLLL
jgi:hypothetical protein